MESCPQSYPQHLCVCVLTHVAGLPLPSQSSVHKHTFPFKKGGGRQWLITPGQARTVAYSEGASRPPGASLISLAYSSPFWISLHQNWSNTVTVTAARRMETQRLELITLFGVSWHSSHRNQHFMFQSCLLKSPSVSPGISCQWLSPS